MAMQMFIVVMVIVTALLVTVTSASLSTSKNAAKRANRAAGLAPGDGAAIKYQQALNAGATNENDGFQLDEANDGDLTKLAAPGESVVPNSSTPYAAHTSVPPESRYTMREQIASGEYGHWQVYRIFPPNYAAGNDTLTVYFRAWTGSSLSTDPATTSEPRMLRAQLRQGAFADYQLLTDGPIAFQANATINGRVHSNGFLDGMQRPPTANSRVWATGSVTCSGAALTSSARGTVDLPASCKRRGGTGEFVNLLRAQASFDRIRADCPTGVTRCFDNTPPPGTAYDVRLLNNQVPVRDPLTGSTTPVGFPASGARAVLINGDVRIYGTTRKRVTIAARNANPAGAAANITIVGDTGRQNVTGSAVGLIAQGHVIVHMWPPNGCPVSNVTAALVAAGGGLTIPPGYTTEMFQKASTPRCSNTLRITGSITSHRTPTLFWQWGASFWAGYPSRSYLWDPQLRATPPPYFPKSESWDIMTWKSASMDCYTATTADCE